MKEKLVKKDLNRNRDIPREVEDWDNSFWGRGSEDTE
jgi:hypothetical protein